MSSWPARLIPWLKKMFFSVGEGEKATVSRLELRQISHGGGDSIVESWSFSDETPKVDLDELASEITIRAQQDCEEAFSGPTSYTVLVYYDGQEFSSGRAPAARFLTTRTTDEVGETEPPNPRGFAAQQMRHNESLVRMLVANSAHVQAHTEKLLDKAYARIEALEDRRSQTFAYVESLKDDEARRKIEEKKAIEGLVREREGWEALKILVPTVVSKLTGQNLLPITTTPELETMHNLLGSLTAEQRSEMLKILKPEQLIGLATIEEAARKREEERQAAADAARAKISKEGEPSVH